MPEVHNRSNSGKFSEGSITIFIQCNANHYLLNVTDTNDYTIILEYIFFIKRSVFLLLDILGLFLVSLGE